MPESYEYVTKTIGTFPDYWVRRVGQMTGYFVRTDNEVGARMLVALLNNVSDEQMDAARKAALEE